MPVTAAEQTPDRPAPDLTDVCQFCFSAQAQKAASDESARLFMSFDLVGATVSGGELALSGTVFVAAYHARAPPSLS